MMQSFPPPPEFGNVAVRELADKIAIAAMHAMLVNRSHSWDRQKLSSDAYGMAGAMLEARKNFSEVQAQKDAVK